MVDVKNSGDDFVFTIQGWHKLWSFRSEITIPKEHIADVCHYKDLEQSAPLFPGLKFPGTNIPGLLTAGTFLTREGTIFYDMANIENSIIITLHDEDFKRLIIEVEDPAAVIEMIKAR